MYNIPTDLGAVQEALAECYRQEAELKHRKAVLKWTASQIRAGADPEKVRVGAERWLKQMLNKIDEL
jgi:DNA/RNA-binding domain of Phe-tRNA-synthetase-like protein